MTTTLRADAERNRGRVLDAARAVFAERGIDAGVAEIADRAGVGVATIFRRFPHKEDLLAAIVEARVQEVAELARRSTTLREFMTDAAALHMADRGFCDTIGTELFERPELLALREEVRSRVSELVRQDQASGAVRTDLTVDDVPVILLGVARSAPPRDWRRYLDFALDGLRPP
jgi:AcrR family transcriptional regulator